MESYIKLLIGFFYFYALKRPEEAIGIFHYIILSFMIIDLILCHMMLYFLKKRKELEVNEISE